MIDPYGNITSTQILTKHRFGHPSEKVSSLMLTSKASQQYDFNKQ